MTTPEDTELRKQIAELFNRTSNSKSQGRSDNISEAMNLITLHTEKSELVELIEQIENLYLCKEISFDTYENELADLDERIDQLTNPTEGSNK